MEDEGFIDDDFIAETAWEYAGLHGRASLSMLRLLAAGAEKSGDAVSALTWRAILEAAERILEADRRPGGIAGEGL